MKKIKRILLAPFAWLIALIFLIEEAIWDWTAKLMARLGQSRFVHAIETHITSLSPRWALVAFLLPSTILIPAKLIGLHVIANGQVFIGGTVFVLAKIIGMALFSRIFNLTRPALMQLGWFAQLYERVMHYRNKLHEYLANWPAYQNIKRHIKAMISRVEAVFKKT